MSSSDPLPPTINPDSPSAPGPATRLLADLFDEMDELTPQPIDSSYILLYGSPNRSARARPTLGISTSGDSTRSPNIPNQPPTSPASLTVPDGSSRNFQYSRPHVDSFEDLQELASRFNEIQETNAQLVHSDREVISNSLPNPKLRSLSSSYERYKEKFTDAPDEEKKTLESIDLSTGLTGSNMRRQIPKLHVATSAFKKIDENGKRKGNSVSDIDEDEENAMKILEGLFGELEDKDRRENEDEWKEKDTGVMMSREINSLDRETVMQELQHVLKLPNNPSYKEGISDALDALESKDGMENAIRAKELEGFPERVEEQQEHSQSKSENGFEAMTFSESGEDGEEKHGEDKWTQSQQEFRDTVSANDNVKKAKEEKNYGDGSDKISGAASFSTASSTDASNDGRFTDGEEEESDNDGRQKAFFGPSIKTTSGILPSSDVEGVNGSDSEEGVGGEEEQHERDCSHKFSDSNTRDGSSTDSDSDEEGADSRGPELEMAALATGVMVVSMWMIERKMGFY